MTVHRCTDSRVERSVQNVGRQRRLLCTAVGSALAFPALHAQVARKPARVGFLGFGTPEAWALPIEAFRTGLKELGWIEGRDLELVFRWASNVDQLPGLATELVRLPVDVILAPASTQVEPARQSTRAIPIVFAQHADPVGTGHVASLARPGGNITGVSMNLIQMASKSVGLLREALPSLRHLGVLWNPTTPSHEGVLRDLDRTAAQVGLQLNKQPVRSSSDFEPAISTLARQRCDAFVVPSSPLTNSFPAPLASIAMNYRLPSAFTNEANVEAGGLMSYGADFRFMYHRAAAFVDRILKGVRAGELPVEQPTSYRLVINLSTARELGLKVPQALLVLAERLIQ